MSRSYRTSKSHQSAAVLLEKNLTVQTVRAARSPSTGPTILLVDDDHGVLVSLARVLASEGWRIVTATNGEEALERLNEQQPDLMITDLSMGDVSGWDLLFHEKMQRPSLPIFVITALPPPEVGGADSFAAEFFQKPLDLDALVAAIHRCLEVSSSV